MKIKIISGPLEKFLTVNVKQFERTMQNLPEQVAEDTANAVRNWARMYAPGPDKSSISTGHLREHIRVRALKKSKFGVYSGAKSDALGEFSPSYHYGPVQETGHSKVRVARNRQPQRRIMSSSGEHIATEVSGEPFMRFIDSRDNTTWVTVRTAQPIGTGQVGKHTIHHFTKAFNKVLKGIEDEGPKWLEDTCADALLENRAIERGKFQRVVG